MRKWFIIGLALLFLVSVPVIAMSFWIGSHGGWMIGRGVMGPHIAPKALTNRNIHKAVSQGFLATVTFARKTPAHMITPRMMRWGHPFAYGFGWFPMLVGSLLFLVLVGLIVLGVYYLVTGRRIRETSRDRSIELLRERFAKGEISEEQFRKMKETLQS